MRRSRGKLSGKTRALGSSKRLTPAQMLKQYKIGDRVVIDPIGRYSGMPHPRYRGKVGTVTKLRGKAYEVKLPDGTLLVLNSVHMHIVGKPIEKAKS